MSKSKILVVDDSKIDQLMIQSILGEYQVISAYNGEEALKLLEIHLDIEIMILDLKMPIMDGFQVLEALKDIKDKPYSIIILTNLEEIENEIKGLDLGAVDFIRKPLNSGSLVKRIDVHLNLIHAKKEIQAINHDLENKVALRTEQLEKSRDITISALIQLLEVRDIESSNHTKRTFYMMKAFAEHLSTKDTYKEFLTPEKIKSLYKTAPLHDIGKVGIKDEILLKPGKLTDDEFKEMKKHVQYGVQALTQDITEIDMNDYLTTSINIINSHHEKYDGTGYPNGTKGEEIPLEGRLMAIIDVYDALTSKRVYKEAYRHDYSIDVLINEKGKHFDPYLIDVFLEIETLIYDISQQYLQG
jgi:putative two-component system response regulator